MCGIVGAVGKKIDKEFLQKLFIATETRGRDATGFWSPKTGIVKGPEKASEFLPNNETIFKKSLNRANIFVGHVRWATHGDPHENRNNHPLESENWILVHNGVVNLPPIENYPYTSETDTEEILAHIEHYGLEDGLAYVSKGAAIILVPKNEPNTFLVWKTNDGAMLAAYDEENSTMYISSGKTYIDTAQTKKTTSIEKLNGFFLEKIEDTQPNFAFYSPRARELWKLTYKQKELKAEKIAEIDTKQSSPATSSTPIPGSPYRDYQYQFGGNQYQFGTEKEYQEWAEWYRESGYTYYQNSSLGNTATSHKIENPRVKRYNRTANNQTREKTLVKSAATAPSKKKEPNTLPVKVSPIAAATNSYNTNRTPFYAEDLVELIKDPVPTDYYLQTTPDKIKRHPFLAGDTFVVIEETTSQISGAKLFVSRTFDGATAILPSYLFDFANPPDCFIEGYGKNNCEKCNYKTWCEEGFFHEQEQAGQHCFGLYIPEDRDCIICPKLVPCLQRKTGVKSF